MNGSFVQWPFTQVTYLQKNWLCDQLKDQCWYLLLSHSHAANRSHRLEEHWSRCTFLSQSCSHLEVGKYYLITQRHQWLCRLGNCFLLFLQILLDNLTFEVKTPVKGNKQNWKLWLLADEHVMRPYSKLPKVTNPPNRSSNPQNVIIRLPPLNCFSFQ